MLANGVPVRIATSYFRADLFANTRMAEPEFVRPTLQAALEDLGYQFGSASDLRKFPVRNVRVLHSVVDLPPGGSFPLWNTAKDFFVMENPWMKNLDVTRR